MHEMTTHTIHIWLNKDGMHAVMQLYTFKIIGTNMYMCDTLHIPF